MKLNDVSDRTGNKKSRFRLEIRILLSFAFLQSGATSTTKQNKVQSHKMPSCYDSCNFIDFVVLYNFMQYQKTGKKPCS